MLKILHKDSSWCSWIGVTSWKIHFLEQSLGFHLKSVLNCLVPLWAKNAAWGIWLLKQLLNSWNWFHRILLFYSFCCLDDGRYLERTESSIISTSIKFSSVVMKLNFQDFFYFLPWFYLRVSKVAKRILSQSNHVGNHRRMYALFSRFLKDVSLASVY